MANRRQGGYGGRSYYNSGPVNPWQVGNVPGGNSQGNAFNSIGSSLLPHLSEPQAQLALAISKLLQPQQQVPSLLTMDTVNPMHHSGGYRPSPDYTPRGRLDMHRRPRHDFKRTDNMYGNKMSSRGARDTDFNRRRDNAPKAGDRKIQPHRTTIVAKRNKSSSAKTAPKPTGKAGDVKPAKEPESADAASTHESDAKRDESENEDKKRDWKEEKSNEDVDVKQEKEDEATGEAEDEQEQVQEENDNDDKNEESGNEKEDKEEKQGASKYDGIPKELLQCRICQKSMWDGESFEKHMNGRTHQQMFEKVEESYRLKADMMREGIRLEEEKNSIEMMRMKRLGKKMKAQQVSRCAMCDLQFEGQLFIHRKSAGHQKLKHFLHPQCNYCKKEFPTRMEWENHRHTPEHFRKKAENGERKEKKKHDNDVLLEEDSFMDIDVNEIEEKDDENVLTDVPEDASEIKNRIPAYNGKRAVGMSLMSPVTGFYCKPCLRFFLTEETMESHGRTKLHHKSFVDILKEKLAGLEERKRKPVEDEEDDDDEGNWKRRKVAKDDQADESVADDSVADDSVADDSKTANEDGSALYDPADSFLSTDPNDICLNSDASKNIDCTGTEVDEVWNEVDEKLDEILDENNKEQRKGDQPPPAVSTPMKSPNNNIKTNPATPATRRTRAKKN